MRALLSRLMSPFKALRVSTINGTMEVASVAEEVTVTSQAPTIEVRCRTEVVGCRGDGHLEALTLADRRSGRVEEVPASWLFIFVGAIPRTDWLGDAVVRDAKGFVVTGPDLIALDRWALPRPPYALETSVPGVFAAGDVRLDSMKRVASAVGEGAMSIYLVHRFLATV